MNKFSDEWGWAYFIFFSLCLPLFFSLSFWNTQFTFAGLLYFFSIGYFITFSCGVLADMFIRYFINRNTVGWTFGIFIAFIILTGIMYTPSEKIIKFFGVF